MDALERKLIELIEAYRKQGDYVRSLNPDVKGNCGEFALRACAKWKRRGVKYWYCLGTYKDVWHAWCEYIDGRTKKRLVDDGAQRIKGWTREECKDYDLKTESDPFYEIEV